jgi:hypothetical protein
MSFKENDRELIRWYKREIEKAGIEVRFNTEINDVGTLRGFDAIISATGAVPRTMPIPGFDKTMSFTELLVEKKPVGDKVLFFGGGQSSCEAAYDLVLHGKHPIIVEFAPDLVAAQATCLANTSFLRDAMEYHKVPVYLSPPSPTSTTAALPFAARTARPSRSPATLLSTASASFPPPAATTRALPSTPSATASPSATCAPSIWRAWDVCMKI